MRIIVSPHCDDEVIGCYSVLKKKKIDRVVYLYELTDERRREAMKVAKMFKFKPVFCEKIFDLANYIAGATELYIPSINDLHPHHKEANIFADMCYAKTKIYYTIDKNIPYSLLSQKDVKAKFKVLNNCYPSQKKLWERDDKYILFEGFREKDYDLWAKVTFQFENTHAWKTIPKNHPESYLKYPHRHIFKCTAWVLQFHDDRDVEFLKLKHELMEKFPDYDAYTQNQSCEMIADKIRHFLSNKFPNRKIRVEVSEDGENGAYIE
jgi:hypothetical protein